MSLPIGRHGLGGSDVDVFNAGPRALTNVIAHEARQFRNPFAGGGP